MNLKTLWSALEDVYDILGGYGFAAMNKAATDMGLNPDWSTWLFAIWLFGSEPITTANFMRIFPYGLAQYNEERFASAVQHGYLISDGKNGYIPTELGMKAAHKVWRVAGDSLAPLKPMPEAQMEKVFDYLARIGEAALSAPEPPSHYFMTHKRENYQRYEVLYPLERFVVFFGELSAYRDDMYVATWSAHGVEGHAWEMLDFISNNGATTFEDLHARLSRRGVTEEVHAGAPFTKQWEGQFALRQVRYEGVYAAALNITTPKLNSTNPKVGVSYRPDKTLLFRGSYGTGFRAPSISEMFRPVRAGITASFVRDPVSGEVGQLPVDRFANPNLKPEKSKQFNIGVVFEPSRTWSGSLDYWTIRKSDIISEIGEETIFSNPVYYNDPTIVRRFSDCFVDVIRVTKENRGKLNTAGFDVALRSRGENGPMGRFGADLVGTILTEYKFPPPIHARRWSMDSDASATTRRFSAGVTS